MGSAPMRLPMSDHAAAPIEGAYHLLCQAAAALRPVDILPGEHQSLGGHLLPCGPEVVHLVSAALLGDQALFSDLQEEGAALRRRQDEADAWARLRAIAARVEHLAADGHLLAQADAEPAS